MERMEVEEEGYWKKEGSEIGNKRKKAESKAGRNSKSRKKGKHIVLQVHLSFMILIFNVIYTHKNGKLKCSAQIV